MKFIGLIAFAAAVGGPALGKPVNDFARFPAKMFDGPLASPKEDAWPDMKNDLRTGINFGGHFTLVGVPCGTGCGAFWLVDRRTGKMIRAPKAPKGLDYESVDNRSNSNLLKVLWVSAKFDGSGETFPPCFRQNYLWTGTAFRPLSKPIESKCPPDVQSH